MLNKQLALIFLIILILGQPITSIDFAFGQTHRPQGQIIGFDNGISFEQSKTFGPSSPITINLGKVAYTISCDGANSRVSNFDWVRDFIYTISDIYISKSPTNINLNRGNPAFISDVNNAHNTVAEVGGVFEDFTIGSTNNIGNGIFDVVYDECQDRRFQRGEDALFSNAITINIPTNFKLSEKALTEFHQSKVWDLTFADSLKDLIQVFEVYKMLEKIGKWNILLAKDPDNTGKVLIEMFITSVNSISKDIGIKFPTSIKVKSLAELVILDYLKKLEIFYRQAAADPPNFNYKNNVYLNQSSDLNLNLDDKKINSLFYSLINDFNNEEVILQAFITSLEHFQGAQIDGNSLWGIIHSESIKRYSDLLMKSSNVNSTISSIIGLLENDFSEFNSEISVVESLRKRIQESGFTLEERKFFKNNNFTDFQINTIREKISSLNISFTFEQIIDVFKSISDNHNSLHDSLSKFSDEINSTTTQIKSDPLNKFLNPPPVSVIDSSHNGFTGQNIIFNGSKSFSENSSIKQFEWDLDGDGLFDDSNDNITSFTYSNLFDGYIGLKVTNTEGISSIDYVPLRIVSQNNSPIIESFTPNEESLNITAGNSQEFAITPIDPNGDNLSIEWFVDDNPVENGDGDSFTYVPSTEDIGPHVISVNVTDHNIHPKSITEDWIVFVKGIDNDLDTWSSNIDCNDNNFNIHPSKIEVRYNGLDDDCNPSTLDNNSPPIAKSIKMATYQNIVATIELTASDIDNDLLGFSIVDGPENGTLRNLKVFPFSNSAVVEYVPNTKFHGTDSFTFIASDSKAKSNIAKVDINIGIFESPTAQFQEITINEDTPTEIELRGTSPDGHALKFFLESRSITRVAGQPGVGTITDFKVTGPYTANLTYTPPPDFSNTLFGFGDIFHFRVSDGDPVPGFPGFESSRASVGITVNNVNDPPKPFNKIVSTVKETPVDILLRSFDGDNDQKQRSAKVNKNLTFGIYSPPSHGTLSNIVTNHLSSPIPSFSLTKDVVTYFPNNGFTGEDSFRFFASDGISQGIGNVTIKVKPTNSISPEFEDGDIIFSTLGTGIHWYKSDGTFVKKLPSAPATAFGNVINVGGAFDSLGNLYVAEFNSLPVYNGTGVSKYNKNGELIDEWRENFGCLERGSYNNGSRCLLPESITIDNDDNVFVGGIATAEGGTLNNEVQNKDERDDIRKFDSNGTFITRFNPSVEKRGSDWVELAPDQCTLYYTSEGRHVKQYDVCNDVQMKDFGDAYGIGRSGEDQGSRSGNFPNYALRLLPDGNMLVASESKIVKLDSTGNIIQTYDIPNEDPLFALNLDPDGKSFWTTSIVSHDIYRIDIESGKVIQHFITSLDGPVMGGISGIIIKGEPTLSTKDSPPTVFHQLLVTNNNSPFEVNITGSDIANDPLNFTIIDQPKFGSLSNSIPITNNISKVVYTPNPDFDGTDSFTYITNDGKQNSNETGEIMIARNHVPVANNDDERINTLQGIPVNINVLANDSDIDIGNPILNDTISIESIDTSETLGNVTLTNDNSTINYVPFAQEYIGQDSFNYTITDRYGLTDTAKVTVNVLSSNNIPVANNQTTETLENTPKTIQLVATDADSNDKQFYQIVTGPSNGYISNFNSTTGIVEYYPLRAFHGEDIFTFKVHDGKDKSLPAFVNITVIDDNINDDPIVESERVSANVGQPISVNVLANDVDPNGDFLAITNFTGPFNGTASLNQDQTITYQSDPDFNASDVLYYRVADQFDKFGIGQLIIDVQGDAVKQIIQVPSDRLVTTTRDQTIDIELVATATIDRPIAFFIIDAPDNGTLGDVTTLSNLSSSIRYTPNNSFVGGDSFTYIAIDDKGVVSNIGTIRVSIDDIPRNPPNARDSQVMLDEDTSIPIQLVASDSDVNDVLTYSIESIPVSGKIINFDPSTGSLLYEPNPNFNGNDGFLFKAVDQSGLESNIATVLITVNPINDPPVANNQQLETNQNIPLQITLSGTDLIDNGALSQFRIVNSPTNGQISNFNQINGELTYTSNNNFFGSDSFTFKVIDSLGLESTNTGLVTINVKSSQEPPNNEQPPLPLPSSVCTDSNNNVKPKGTQGNDDLIGTSQRDTITGLGGNDRFNGCSNNDTLNGNSGNDGIAGGPDDDKIHGNEGNDYLQGDTGSDSLYGNEGNDILVGNEDRDRFFCGSGDDTILDFDYPLDVKSNDCEEF